MVVPDMLMDSDCRLQLARDMGRKAAVGDAGLLTAPIALMSGLGSGNTDMNIE